MNLVASLSFITMINNGLSKIPINIVPSQCECSDRAIYRQYLLGLRKTKHYLRNTTNINRIASILNFTNDFVETYKVNNTDVAVKNIIMGNIVLDVSNVKEIHISTTKDKIIVKLDKQKKNMNVLKSMNNIESVISTILLLGKILDIN